MKYFTGQRKLREWTGEERKYIEKAVLLIQHPPQINLYRDIAFFLNKATGADYVTIGKTVTVDQKTVRTLAFTYKQSELDNLVYDTRHAPCEYVLGHNFHYYPEKLQELFPLDDSLRTINVHSYMAVALNDQENNTIGVLSLMHKEKLAHPEMSEHLLFMLAALLEENVLVDNLMQDNRSEENLNA